MKNGGAGRTQESSAVRSAAARGTKARAVCTGPIVNSLTHVDERGLRMVDVGDKPLSARRAVAEGVIRMAPDTLNAILAGSAAKGDVLAAARLAAIGGAKRTPDLIPLCHPLPLDRVDVDITAEPALPGLRLRVEACAHARTGTEMEAMCGAAAGLLCVYDMCKAVDRGMRVGPIRLLEKEGGSSGVWRSEDTP